MSYIIEDDQAFRLVIAIVGSDEHLTALALRYGDNRKISEIAMRMGVSRETVRDRIHVAAQKLQDAGLWPDRWRLPKKQSGRIAAD